MRGRRICGGRFVPDLFQIYQDEAGGDEGDAEKLEEGDGFFEEKVADDCD